MHLLRLLATIALSCIAVTAAGSTAPCSIDTRSAPIGGGTITYNVAGSGPSVLLLHGLFADKEQWSALACKLADAGYRTIAVDLPGYGKSSGYPISAYRLERQVDLLAALAKQIGLDRFDLAGNSMGGAIASLYAHRHPAQVRSIAFIGSPFGIVGWHPDLRNAIYRGINPFVPIDATQLDLEMQLLFVKPPALPDATKAAVVANYVKRNRHYVQVWNIVSLYDRVLAQSAPTRTSTLIVWGDDDRVFPVAGAQTLGRRIPGSEVRRLPGAGHLLHMESVDAVAPVYVGFLKTAANAPSGVGLANPASQNCGAKGGMTTIEQNGKGDQFGVCLFPDNLQCEEWAMLRGDCRSGGIKVTGYVTPAARYCAITGGAYAITSGSNTPDERGTCTFKGGKSCDAAAYFAGTCSR